MPTRRPLIWILSFIAAYELVIYTLLKWSAYDITNLQHFAVLHMQWDALHVFSVAKEGLLKAEIHILPVLPSLSKFIETLGFTPEIALWLASKIFTMFGLYYFYLFSIEELGKAKAQIAFYLLLAFPTSFFLHMPYMEAALFTSLFAALYYARKKEVMTSSLFSFLTPLSRINGVFIAPLLLLREGINRKNLWRILAVVLGFGFYLLLNKLTAGSYFYFLEHQKNWGVENSYPFSGAINAIRSWELRSNEEKLFVIILPIFATLLSLYPLIWCIKEKRYDYLSWQLLNIFSWINLSFWLSPARFTISLFPLFFCFADKWKKWPKALRIFICIVFISLHILFLKRYLDAKWVA